MNSTESTPQGKAPMVDATREQSIPHGHSCVPVIFGPMAFEFSSHQHWVNKAQIWYTRLANENRLAAQKRYLAIDAVGRVCMIGGDFARARDEDAFPVRVYLLDPLNGIQNAGGSKLPMMVPPLGETHPDAPRAQAEIAKIRLALGLSDENDAPLVDLLVEVRRALAGHVPTSPLLKDALKLLGGPLQVSGQRGLRHIETGADHPVQAGVHIASGKNEELLNAICTVVNELVVRPVAVGIDS